MGFTHRKWAAIELALHTHGTSDGPKILVLLDWQGGNSFSGVFAEKIVRQMADEMSDINYSRHNEGARAA